MRDFGQETAPLFLRQIKADLGYFQHGTDLINTAIASIRGIVEIDQTEGDRHREKTEKDSNQKLQDLIQSVGVGIAAGAIVASSSGLITQPWYLPNAKKVELSLLPHPFFIALIFSALCSVGALWIATIVISNRQEKS